MLTFHPLSLNDKPLIDRFVNLENSHSADFFFGNMLLWDDTYKQMVADTDHHLIALCCNEEVPIFPFPIADENLSEAIILMREYAEANGFPLVICGVEERHRALLMDAFPGCFSYVMEREYADYVYDIEKLISLKGKKLHAKRNHCSRFEREHPDWHFEKLTPQQFDICRTLFHAWAESAEDVDGSIEEEHKALELAFQYYDTLNLLGGVLYIEDEPVAFSIGEKCCRDTVDIHFEKANADIDGCYPMINRELAKLVRQQWPETNYVNREDDMGLDALRKSKLSYHPDILLEKYCATWVGAPTLRDANDSDFEDILALWHDSFGDSNEFISELLDQTGLLKSATVAEVNGKVRCAMFAFEGLDWNGKSCAYLYALGTAPEYRGRGLGAAVCKTLARKCFSKGADFVFLSPANEGLTDWYSSVLDAKPLQGWMDLPMELREVDADVQEISAEKYFSLRRSDVCITRQLLTAQEIIYRHYGGGFFRIDFGQTTAIACVDLGETPLVRELLCEPSDQELVCSALANHLQTPNIFLRVPSPSSSNLVYITNIGETVSKSPSNGFNFDLG